MPRRDDDHGGGTLVTLVTVALVVTGLYVAREVVLPLALASLLMFILTPPAVWLEHHGVRRVPAVLLVTALACGVAGGIGWVVVSQLKDLARTLAADEARLVNRIHFAQRWVGQEGELTRTFDALAAALTGEGERARPAGEPVEAPKPDALDHRPVTGKPVPVRVVGSNHTVLRFLYDWLGPLLAPFGTAALVLVFLIFMLLQRDDLRDRFLRLSGAHRLTVTTHALDEARNRISRYLSMLLLVNGGYGVAIGTGLWLIGLPNPLLWGLLAGTLRFIPYLGPPAAAVLPILLSIAIAPGWHKPVLVVALFASLELVIANFLEPWLYGTSTGVSMLALLVMASFWTWMWGPLGLVLSMPLTVCLVVLGRFVPQLNWLNVLLGDAPALSLRQRYYQRLLALDYHEAGEVVGEALKSGSVEQLYTDILMPALSLAERDRQSGDLVETQRQFALQTIRDTVEELGEKARTPEQAAAEGANPKRVRVWCVPAEDDADEIAGTMTAQLLVAHGFTAEAVPAGKVDEAVLEHVAQDATDAVLISAVAPGGVIHARRLCKKLRPKRARLALLVGLWNATGPLEQAEARLKAAGADALVTRLEDAIKTLQPQGDADHPPQREKLEPAAAAR
jgi:predicted PurR-regulated permease PerM/methanogenic corrinoid protein MtbC1